uniref:ORF6 protein n=6 Tax=Severe acute respiratory syndrome coronavirus 2 TaxID=2697049 RepID=A0A898K9Q1_SARS2|nr:ORF6x protein [Severe acute respiratory syndrome coronavirus 2]QSJ03258.1 ORF6x protein [Severe acute respiratory syndrome coronavirus 2]
MFHLVDFQVTIAEILLIIMRTFKVSIWNLDYIINLIIKNLSKSLTENKYSQLDEEQPVYTFPGNKPTNFRSLVDLFSKRTN